MYIEMHNSLSKAGGAQRPRKEIKTTVEENNNNNNDKFQLLVNAFGSTYK